MQEMWVWSQGREDSLQKGRTTHSTILIWQIPQTEEPGGLELMELQRLEHDLVTKQQQQERQINNNLNFILYMSQFKMDHTDGQQAYEKILITANY